MRIYEHCCVKVAEKPKDFSRAILEKKMSPNTFLVDDSLVDEYSSVSINPAKLEELQLFAGDTVLLKGKKRKETVAIVVADESCTNARIRINKVARSNLRFVHHHSLRTYTLLIVSKL